MFGFKIGLLLATFIAMSIATKVTLTYARRPDGMINQYGQAQHVLPDGRVTFPDPQRPGGVVDIHGAPVHPTAPVQVEKALWRVWAEMFGISELAGVIIMGLLSEILRRG